MSFWQKPLIKGIPSGKAITVVCTLAEFLFFSWIKAPMCRGHTSASCRCVIVITWKSTPLQKSILLLFCFAFGGGCLF